METAATTNPTQEVTMNTFTATVLAADAAQAAERVARHLAKVDGFESTGRVSLLDQKHLLWNVEVANNGGNVNHCWVILTSYGITPGEELGSTWQTVPGVGCFA